MDICGGFYAHLLDIGANEVGMMDIDEIQFHGDELSDEVNRLLGLRVNDPFDTLQ